MNAGNEPVRIVNHLLTLVRLGLALAVSLGAFSLTAEQLEQAVGFAGALFAVVEVMATEWARSKVTPLAKFPSERVRNAINKGKHHKVKIKEPPPATKPVAPPVDHYQEPGT